MSQDAERVKRLLDFRQKLESKVKELELDLKEQQAALEIVSELLLEKGFKRPNVPKEAEEEVVPGSKEVERPEPEVLARLKTRPDGENMMELRAVNGELLARLYNDGKSLRVVPAEDKDFDINVSPFGHFLVERVLTKMQERDSELARIGKLQPVSILSYNISRDGDIIREITIRNVDSERLKELTSSIRWTLEKMYEKMQSES